MCLYRGMRSTAVSTSTCNVTKPSINKLESIYFELTEIKLTEKTLRLKPRSGGVKGTRAAISVTVGITFECADWFAFSRLLDFVS